MGQFKATLAAAALAFLAAPAMADVEADYREGDAAYRRGDIVRALGLLKQAAEAGHAKAQAGYAQILDSSDFDAEAIDYYRKSAEQGEAAGQYGLGSMLAAGEGAKRDPKEAYAWFLKAAEQGHGLAIRAVANAYVIGDLELDEAALTAPEAAVWINRAAELDHIPAVEALARAYEKGGFGITPDAQKAAIWTQKLNKLRPHRAKR